MEDIVVRNASIVDGLGTPSFRGDIAATAGVLTQVGGKAGRGKREIDAGGCIVTPGFVDVHTHYDGQINWDATLSCSSWHGVTSVVFGNCGVGFAPARAAGRESLIDLMETIEDIPAQSLRTGIDWRWETFPEYLDVLERTPLAIDAGMQIPHAAVRAYVMGERGIDNEPATGDDMEAMKRIVREGMEAGALGLTGTRCEHHRSATGKDAPGYGLPTSEILALASAAAAAGRGGVVGINVDWVDIDEEARFLRELRRTSGMPVFFLLNHHHYAPERFLKILAALEEADAAGERVTGQHAARPINYLMGLMSSRNPFWERPSYAAIADRPLEERVARMRDPEFRARLLAESANYRSGLTKIVAESFHRMFPLGDPPDYEPPPEKSVAAIAAAQGRSPQEVVYDMMLERDGHQLIFMPVTNYVTGDASSVWKMLHHPCTILGLGDAGAHATRICDASIPTFMLTHWARDRSRGPKLSLEDAVRKQTSSTAGFYGLHDRGALVAGKKADLNVIDFEGMVLHAPEMIVDQPGGAHRLVQRADGYVATIVSGTPVFENGKATGEMPGRLIRGSRRG